jgi:hypothetical protein
MPPLDEKTVEEEWAAAVRDAELDADACRLMCLEAANGPTSGHYPPGRTLGADELIDDDVAATLNESANIDRHRVVVLRDVPAEAGRELFAAKLRHELEHARQWEAVGDVAQQLSCIVDELIEVVAGGFNEDGRAIYHAQPVERDANAAASHFVRRRFAAETLTAIAAGSDAVLVEAGVAPGALDTLPARMVAFLFQYADVCEGLVDGFESFADRLAAISPEAVDRWRELNGEPGSPPGPPENAPRPPTLRP